MSEPLQSERPQGVDSVLTTTPVPEQPEVLVQLDRIIGPVRDQALAVMKSDPTIETEQQARETPNKRACERFKTMRTMWHALWKGGRETEIEPVLEQLHRYFLSRENGPEDTTNFTLKNANNAICRVYDDDQRFLAMLLGFMMTKTESDASTEIGRPAQRLAMKAKEFDASRKRRLAFDHYGKPGGTQNDQTRDLLAAEAETALLQVLVYWRQIGDTASQTRTLYELGMIEQCRQHWEKAGYFQNESAIVAEKTGDHLGAAIARIESAEILLKSDGDPEKLLDNFRQQTAKMEELAVSGLVTAQSWVSNALKCQAGGCIALAKKELAAGRKESARRLKNEAIACCRRVMNDVGCYLVSLGEAGRKIQTMHGPAMLTEAEAIAID